ncbi:hypothetical protein QFC22_000562 [Naganishia vaughanmartiniae]|uniref:Uncharacterized protein n=1 Tax=Naganishia vaughanmartiniae TaxID=1424756 RepID=A0ACC2XPP9_9TREE|nr:hypothetical protein QFC22_000562 [Naganishia vaughanmartiniae]
MDYVPQYAYRAQKSVGLIDAHPSYTEAESFPTVHIVSTTSANVARTLELPNAIDVAFSPKGRFFFTWERLAKVEDGEAGHKNLKIWWLGSEDEQQSGTPPREIGGFVQKAFADWQPLVNDHESHLLRISGPSEISIFEIPSELPDVTSFSAETEIKTIAEAYGLFAPISKLRIDGPSIRSIWLSPSKSTAAVNGSSSSAAPVTQGKEGVAIWTGEYKAAPANVSLYTLRELIDAVSSRGGSGPLPMTQARKNFFKGDKVLLKWNKTGNIALFLTTSDIDNSGKSYYGETNLYLINLNGQYECKVTLEKEGPIHDFVWNPNSREFAVTYGYVPARTTLFDAKANEMHSFGTEARNFLKYQPQGRLLLSAGFGNLNGNVDIWDLRSRKKVCEFSAPNSTVCEWSPCGRFILTGILSPRLRVDNGVKIWWCAGKLLHVQLIDELYQTTWRPNTTDIPFPAEIPAAPQASPSVAQFAPKAATIAAKPAGAYRPPGARGSAAPDIFKRQEDGAAAASPATATPRYVPGQRTPKPRTVPGAPDPSAVQGNGKQNKKKKGGAAGSGAATPVVSAPPTPVQEVAPIVDSAADAEGEVMQKKIRNLNKKLKAINDLKERRDKGEALEGTQFKKIDGERDILAELSALEKNFEKLKN